MLSTMETIEKYKNDSLNKVCVGMIKHTHTHIMPCVSYKQSGMEMGHHRGLDCSEDF